MTRRPFAAFLLLLGCGAITTAASAQVFYEPVTYQYRTGDVTYYYGGHNPRIFDHVANDAEQCHAVADPIGRQPKAWTWVSARRSLAQDQIAGDRAAFLPAGGN